jgi:YegS/Rv2252/BmrU family lipid kinase
MELLVRTSLFATRSEKSGRLRLMPPPCVIFNPAARGEKARHFRDHLAALSSSAELKPTYAPGSGRALAREAVQEGFTTIVAAGGDGTLNEVVNGIHDANGTERCRLGVLPLGTINVFARELRLPTAFDAAWRIIESGREQLIDLPSVEFNRDGAPTRQVFAQLAGAGLDSRAIELVNWELKKKLGPVAYVVAGFKALAEPKPKIIASSARDGGQGELVLIGNGRYYGGSFELFPDASLDDGLLDVTIFPNVNWETLIKTGWGWLTDQIRSSAGCLHFKTDRVTLTSPGAVSFELDGDNAGSLPATFTVTRKALRVLVP